MKSRDLNPSPLPPQVASSMLSTGRSSNACINSHNTKEKVIEPERSSDMEESASAQRIAEEVTSKLRLEGCPSLSFLRRKRHACLVAGPWALDFVCPTPFPFLFGPQHPDLPWDLRPFPSQSMWFAQGGPQALAPGWLGAHVWPVRGSHSSDHSVGLKVGHMTDLSQGDVTPGLFGPARERDFAQPEILRG